MRGLKVEGPTLRATVKHTIKVSGRPVIAAAVSLAALAIAAPAQAYVGDSFLSIPGVTGAWKGKAYKGWIRAESNEWAGRLRRLSSGSSNPLAGDKLFFGGPNAPKPGNFGKLVVTLSKANPDYGRLMALCNSKASFAEVDYAESSDRARPIMELGARPKGFPEYWHYKLKDVVVADCPVAEGAQQQAFVLAFKDIAWLNYDAEKPLGNKIEPTVGDIPKVYPTDPSAKKGVKWYVITWIAPAADTGDKECPVLNTKPTEADVIRYYSAEDAAALKKQNGEKGISYGQQTEARGPGKLNAVLMPGIVPDPGLVEPKSNIADGIDLDGDDGAGAPPKGIRKHKNYTSPDGRTGIDNQFYAISGCVAGFRGKTGYRNQTSNARRADGNITTLIEVSGIDDERNDDQVEVAIIYSRDKPMRDTAGKVFIPNYTFRPTDDPNFTLFNMRVKGRIHDGVVMTDTIPKFDANLGQDPLLELFKARIRLEPQPDGTMKGILGGYRDWRRIAEGNGSGYSEGLFGYQAPAVYYALQREADGLQNPITGEYDGISVAYEIDTVPAFMTKESPSDMAMADKALAENAHAQSSKKGDVR